ncbi:MAG: aminoacetone oxidase family FAD-binding enzyme [Phycisphaerales bacterium]|nr:MAG: aminoacetone oxidase family FAD-binding enzyme [Phycisphaerales bacterium]
MAAIAAGRALQERSPGGAHSVAVFDGARTLGAKILVAGGGRCNVTHHEVTERAYAGSTPNAIKSVLRRFGVPDTVRFFEEIGVTLKREDTGKLFPTTDRARSVLDALLGAADAARVRIHHPWRIDDVRADDDGFLLTPPDTDEDGAPPPPVRAARVILATGGRSLPKTGSDGRGYDIVRGLGHSVTERVFPALVPLTTPRDHPLCALSGVTLRATIELRSATNKRLVRFTDSTLLTHFGLSGPSVLDISRYYTDAVRDDPGSRLVANWLPDETPERMDKALLDAGPTTPVRLLRDRLPERLVRTLCDLAGVDGAAPASALTREQRRALARALTECELPITGDRGYTYAEVTAGGVPLRELRLETMESRIRPGLHLCGEICDVDGRIGGFNFQWAWASGHVAGTAAAGEILQHAAPREA